MMNKTNETLAEAYYIAMGQKNPAGMEKHLHSNVQFISPFAQLQGKESVIDAAKKFMALFQTLTIRTKFSSNDFDSNDQVMVVYDVAFPAPIGNIPTAALLTFQEERITKIELFFDGRPF